MEQVTEVFFNDGTVAVYVYQFPPEQRAECVPDQFGISLALHYGDIDNGVRVVDHYPWHRIKLYRSTEDYRKLPESESQEEQESQGEEGYVTN